MKQVACWLCSSLERVFKRTTPKANSHFRLDMACSDKGSFQACIRHDLDTPAKLDVIVNHPDEIKVKVRRVGHVPIPHFNTSTSEDELDGIGHVPGYVPDPLFEDLEVLAAPKETETYWISVSTECDTPSGKYEIDIVFRLNEDIEYCLSVTVPVYPLAIRHREDFPVTHWFYADAICDWYKVEPFDDAFWKVVEPFISNLVSHGTNVMHSPIFTPPTDGFKRPNQLLRIKKEQDSTYVFDWTDVKRWVSQAKKCGMEYFEWVHLFSQWGVEHAIPIYENYDGCYNGRMLWEFDTPADSDIYKNFLSQFLPEFQRFLDKEDLLDKSFFHVSDEPHGDKHLQNYRIARAILSELAPWMKVMDALSETTFAKEGLTDMPVASIGTSLEFRDAGIPRWDYFCCGPRGSFLNRLLDTPLSKIRGAGWLFYRLGALGFLHWGYNYWHKRQTRELIDPYTVLDSSAWPDFAYGDPFVVYPGQSGPIDSIRWEVFAESLQDYALLQTLCIDREDDLLCSLRSYSDYPKDAMWYSTARTLLVSGA